MEKEGSYINFPQGLPSRKHMVHSTEGSDSEGRGRLLRTFRSSASGTGGPQPRFTMFSTESEKSKCEDPVPALLAVRTVCLHSAGTFPQGCFTVERFGMNLVFILQTCSNAAERRASFRAVVHGLSSMGS